jgi:hypothetical protein
MPDEPHGRSRRDVIRNTAVAAGLVWATPAVKSVRMLGATGTPSPGTTTSTTLPPPSACPTIDVDVFANGFSLPGRPYDAGDVLVVTVGPPASSPPPTTIELLIVRESPLPQEQFVQNAAFPNTFSFTFPETGVWFVQATVDGGRDATFTASCSPAA